MAASVPQSMISHCRDSPSARSKQGIAPRTIPRGETDLAELYAGRDEENRAALRLRQPGARLGVRGRFPESAEIRVSARQHASDEDRVDLDATDPRRVGLEAPERPLEPRQGTRVLAGIPVGGAQVVLDPELQVLVLQLASERERPLAGGDGLLVAADRSHHPMRGREDRAKPSAVSDPDGEGLGLPHALEQVTEPRERSQRRPEVEPQVDGLLERLPRLGQLRERVQRLLEACRRLPIRPPGERQDACATQVGHGLVPHAGGAEVAAERRGVRIEVGVMHRLDRLAGLPVEHGLACREKHAGGHLANAIVGEVEAFARVLQDAAAHQLLQCLGGDDLGEPGRAGDERELERAADDGGHRQKLAGRAAEAVQAPSNEGLHARREPEPGRPARSVLVEGATHLDNDERVAAAGRPALGGEPRQGRRVKASSRELADERVSLGLGERPQPQLLAAAAGDEVVERPPGAGRVDELLFARGRDDQEPPGVEAAADEREEPDAHVVGPVEVLQEEDDRLPLGEATRGGPRRPRKGSGGPWSRPAAPRSRSRE